MSGPDDLPLLDDDPDFRSGPWTGYWLEGGVRFRQDLALRFLRGAVTGEGIDTVGRFRIEGQYDVETRGVSWAKAYFGAYSVTCRGFGEASGIWGVWESETRRGGFHVWPKPDKGERHKPPEVEWSENEDAPVGAIEPGIIYG